MSGRTDSGDCRTQESKRETKSGPGSDLRILIHFAFGPHERAKVLVVSRGFLLDVLKRKRGKQSFTKQLSMCSGQLRRSEPQCQDLTKWLSVFEDCVKTLRLWVRCSGTGAKAVTKWL